MSTDKKLYYMIKPVNAYPSTFGKYAGRKGFRVVPSVEDEEGYVICHNDRQQEWMSVREFDKVYKPVRLFLILRLIGITVDFLAFGFCLAILYRMYQFM